MRIRIGPASSRSGEFAGSPGSRHGVPAKDIRSAARLFAKGGNGAIYYGLGVTEHSQGTTMVMGMANLAMATGNLGRRGVGVNPLRGQNNVQGACDMGSFPHELPGYRHISDDATRTMFETFWGAPLDNEPGLRIPTCLMPPSMAPSRASMCRARIWPSPIPTPSMWPMGFQHGMRGRAGPVPERNGEFAHVFLPGSTFLEKDGTFTNAERRIQRVRKVMGRRTSMPGARAMRIGKSPCCWPKRWV